MSRPRKSESRISPPVLAGSAKSGAGWPNRRPVIAPQYILRTPVPPAASGPTTHARRGRDEGQRDVPEGRGDAPAAARRCIRRPLDEDRLRRSRHGKFIDVATEAIFGMLWTRPGLDLKTRTLVCVVSDAATGREPELAIHLRMALRQGWTEDELTEVLIQL